MGTLTSHWLCSPIHNKLWYTFTPFSPPWTGCCIGGKGGGFRKMLCRTLITYSPEQTILSLFLMQVLFSVELIIFMGALYGCLIKCKSGYSVLPIAREQTVQSVKGWWRKKEYRDKPVFMESVSCANKALGRNGAPFTASLWHFYCVIWYYMSYLTFIKLLILYAQTKATFTFEKNQ